MFEAKFSKSILFSIAIHVGLITFLVLTTFIQGCKLRNEPLDLVEFTIAVDPPLVEPEPDIPEIVPEVKPTPPKPDDIAIDKPKPKPKPKQSPPKPKKEKKPIQKGERITRKTPSPVPPKEKQKLSDAEIEKWLNKGAKIGATTSLPANEASLNASLLMKNFYDAWRPPTREESGNRPAVVVFGISRDGTLINPRISVSSGSSAYDNSCIDAVLRVGRVRDLSPAFIKQYGKSCEFEFKQQN